MSRFPHVRREQVPITDPRWLASTQPDPEPEVDEPDSPLTERRRDELRDTPSDVLPRRVPGEALREAQEAAVSEFESEGGTSGPGEAARPGESNLARPLLGRWVC